VKSCHPDQRGGEFFPRRIGGIGPVFLLEGNDPKGKEKGRKRPDHSQKRKEMGGGKAVFYGLSGTKSRVQVRGYNTWDKRGNNLKQKPGAFAI